MKLLSKRSKYLLAAILNAVLVIIFFLWFAHRIHWHQMLYDITHISMASLYWVMILDIVVSVLYSYRLKLLLKSSLLDAWRLVCIGNGLNSVLPFRLGDVIRVYCAKHHYAISMDKMIAATFIERYFDLLMLIILGGFILIFGTAKLDQSVVLAVGILFLFSLIGALLYRMMTKKASFNRWLSQFAMIRAFINSLSRSAEQGARKRLFLASAAIWLGLVVLYKLFFSLNLLTGVTWQLAALLCFMTTLAFAVPYVVAGIGVFESAVIFYLVHTLQIPTTEAVALAVVFHFIFSLPQVLLMAGIFLARKFSSLPSFLNIKRF